MAISQKAAGTWARIVTDPSTVTIPGSPAAGDRMYLWVAWKDFAITVTTPAGWTPIGSEYADGSVTAGNGTGSVKVMAWYRDWQPGDGNPSIDWSAAPTEGHAVIILWQKGATESWDTPISETAPMTNWTTTPQVTTNGNTTVIPSGSVVMGLIGIRDDSATMTRPTDAIAVSEGTVTWNGNYVESPATHFSSTTGLDMSGDLGYRLVTTGATASLQLKGTISAAETGAIKWVVQGLAAMTADIPVGTLSLLGVNPDHTKAAEAPVAQLSLVDTALAFSKAAEIPVAALSLVGTAGPKPTDISNLYAWYKGEDGLFDATSGGSAVTADEGLIARWEDQSGNGRHLTQAVAGTRPKYDATKKLVVGALPDVRHMDCPASFDLDRQGFFIGFICENSNLRRAQNGTGVEYMHRYFHGTANNFEGLYDGGFTLANVGELSIYNGSSFLGLSVVPLTTKLSFIAFRGNATNLKFWADNVTGTGTALASGTITLENFMGSGDEASPLQAGVKDIFVYDRALTDAEVDYLLKYAYDRGVQDDYKHHVVFEGDSLTHGYGTKVNRNWPSKLSMPGKFARFRVTAESGIQVQTLASQASTFVDPLQVGGAEKNVLVLWAGTNDIAIGGRTGAQVHADIESYCDSRRSAGWDRIIVIGPLPRGGTSISGEYANLRNALIADHAFADAFIDPVSDVRLDDASDSTYFNADATHLTDAGYAVIAELVEDTLAGYLVDDLTAEIPIGALSLAGTIPGHALGTDIPIGGLAFSQPASSGFLSGYTRRKKITIDHTNVDSNLTDFPLKVKFASDFQIAADIDNDGFNIRFTSADGTTLLKYERESFTTSQAQGSAGLFWVKVPTINGASNTDIYMYYKGGSGVDGEDATNVWDNDFVAVYHFNEDPSGTAPQILDSTSGGNNATSSGSMTSGDVVAGQVGNALDFDGADDALTTPITNAFNNFTAEVIFKATGATSDGDRLIDKDYINGFWLGFGIGAGADMWGGGIKESVSPYGRYVSLNADDGNFHQLVARRNGTTHHIIADGGSASTSGTVTADALDNESIRICTADASGGGAAHPPVVVDEVRISGVARSDAWIKFTYHNIFATDSEISFGSEETSAGEAVTTSKSQEIPLAVLSLAGVPLVEAQTNDVVVGILSLVGATPDTSKQSALDVGVLVLVGVTPSTAKQAGLDAGLLSLVGLETGTAKQFGLNAGALSLVGITPDAAGQTVVDLGVLSLIGVTPNTTKQTEITTAQLALIGTEVTVPGANEIPFGILSLLGVIPNTTKQATVRTGVLELSVPRQEYTTNAADDAWWHDDDLEWITGGTIASIQAEEVFGLESGRRGPWTRFTGINKFPNTKARIVYTAAGTSPAEVVRTFLENADNPTMPVDDFDASTRVMTGSVLNNVPAVQDGDEFALDITPLVQQVVGRSGFVSGNAINIYTRGTAVGDPCNIPVYTAEGGYPARLEIYQESPATAKSFEVPPGIVTLIGTEVNTTLENSVVAGVLNLTGTTLDSAKSSELPQGQLFLVGVIPSSLKSTELAVGILQLSGTEIQATFSISIVSGTLVLVGTQLQSALSVNVPIGILVFVGVTLETTGATVLVDTLSPKGVSTLSHTGIAEWSRVGAASLSILGVEE